MDERKEIEESRALETSGPRRIRLFLIGLAMGTADLIPGVSGGTIALIARIYDEFIASLKAVTNTAVGHALRGRFLEAWRALPFGFLVPLALGIGTAIFTLAQLMTWLLDTYPELVWAFFFGLILASVYIIFKRIRVRTLGAAVAAVFGIIGAYFLTGLIPVETPATALLFFLSGAVAITAMVLPGISGSFILVVLGKYPQVIAAVAERDFATLAVFAAGMFAGLAAFSRLISYFLRTHHDLTIALLGGVMVGSLRAIWPWKQMLPGGLGRNILPEAFDASVLLALLLASLGAVVIVVFEGVLSKKGE